MHQQTQPHPKTAAAPLLAVWAVPDLGDNADVCRRLIEHYSDPGDLVLLPARQKRLAARLGRRALALEPLLAAGAHSGEAARTVAALPPPAAQLALVTLDCDAAHTDAAAARVERLLAPGGFAVLDLSAHTQPRLGDTVARLRATGMRYWQHLIAFDPGALERRPHADLLVFRRPAAAAVGSRARRAA
jgi:hypothetical protein